MELGRDESVELKSWAGRGSCLLGSFWLFSPSFRGSASHAAWAVARRAWLGWCILLGRDSGDMLLLLVSQQRGRR